MERIAQLAGSSFIAQMGLESTDVKSCCAALYQLEPVRLLLGDTLHPGGLALTHRLGKLVDIQRDDLVLDVACGRGASSMAVARSFHCRVVGVDLGREGTYEASRLAKEQRIEGITSFVHGDVERLPLSPDTFDDALCECSMSLFPDKVRGVAEVARLLRPGGKFGVSDVTVEPACLPEELTGGIAQMLCLAGALPVSGYGDLLNSGGLTLVHQQDASESALKLLEDIESKLAAFRLLQALQGQPGSAMDLVALALPIIEKVKSLVSAGSIGYWLFVAEKRG